jgi:hypothetical protein
MQAAQLSSRQRGDFQTPEELARLVWSTLESAQYDLIIEPTFGTGAFLRTCPPEVSATVLGWEIHREYYESTKQLLRKDPACSSFRLFHSDVFTARPSDINSQSTSRVLVIGNPPWVTNSEQSSLGGQNTGTKRNLKELSGLDALTGKANFDISEAIILHLVELLADVRLAQFAFLGKFTVLRNLMRFLRVKRNVGCFAFHRINASRYFGASVDAGLIKFQVGTSVNPSSNCVVLDGISGSFEREIGFVDSGLVYDLKAYRETLFHERSCHPAYLWRQGVKHDLSAVFELTEIDGTLRNQLGDPVDVEREVLHRLYKSSDIFNGREPRYLIPIYQRDLKDDLDDLPQRYPRLYAYLQQHREKFMARKSSIYRNKNPFALFGIGGYTYAPYKIAIGGLYSEPNFRLLSKGTYPAIIDDTSYALTSNEADEAEYLLAVLNLESSRKFLKSISYSGDKRRFSKEVLGRLNIPHYSEVPPEVRNDLSNQERLTGWLKERDKEQKLFE